MRVLAWFWRWLGSPWTPVEKDQEAEVLAAIANHHAARGTSVSGIHTQRRFRATRDLARRRRRMRVLGGLAVVVIAASLASPFTSNRLIDGIQLGAVAAAAPVALMLGLREPSGVTDVSRVADK